jgi:hypothetical protein
MNRIDNQIHLLKKRRDYGRIAHLGGQRRGWRISGCVSRAKGLIKCWKAGGAVNLSLSSKNESEQLIRIPRRNHGSSSQAG